MSGQALDAYGGDLRNLANRSAHDVAKLRDLLQGFPGIGPTGTDIFCREVQAAWAWLRPYLDQQTAKGARRLGLPPDDSVAKLVPGDKLASLAAALVRVAHSADLAKTIKAPGD